MTDVERFFRRLVSSLAASDPARLHQPVPLDAILTELLPYRTNRRALQVETSEDYEYVLLRLCAGEGGLVRAEPEEARTRFIREAASTNPDLEALHSFERVELLLRPDSVARALNPASESAAPARRVQPEEPVEPELVLGSAQFDDVRVPEEVERSAMAALEDLVAPLRAEDTDADDLGDPTVDLVPADDGELEDEAGEEVEVEVPESRPSCIYCGGSLPGGRAVNFCPHCGQSQTKILCHKCRSEVEPGWRHCVNCGAAVGEG